MATPTTLPASFTAGQVLTAAQMNDLRGAFRILQVVSATTTTVTTVTSTTFVDTSLTATITPQSSTSKILVLSNQTLFVANAGDSTDNRLVRGSTTIANQIAQPYSTSVILGQITYCYLDSPATTSATTYKTTFNRSAGAGNVTAQFGSATGSMILLEVSA
jgi:hypothetical protein